MADRLPPLEPMPELAPGEEASPAARWASRFAPSDRSIAQRLRKNRDIREFAKELQTQREQHLQERLATDRDARDLHFRQQAADFREAQAKKHDAQDYEIHQERLKTEASRQSANKALERERLARERAINEKSKRDAQMRTDFFNEFDALNKDATLKPGDYARKAIEIGMKFGPSVPASVLKILTDSAKITGIDDPAEAASKSIAAYATAHQQLNEAIESGQLPRGTGLRFSQTPTGHLGITISPPTQAHAIAPKILDPELSGLQQQLKIGEADQQKATATSRATMEPRLRTIRERIAKRQSELAAPSPPVAPAAPAAPTAPATEPTLAPAPEQQKPKRPLADIFQ